MRLSVSTLDYLKKVIRDTQAETLSEAIRLIVTERMIKDRENGEIRPFEFTPAPTIRERRKKRTVSIDTGELGTFPLGEAPPIGDPLTPSADAGIGPTSGDQEKETAYFGKKKKPIYPGTMEEYIEALKKKRISRDQFRPPVE